MLFSGFSRFVPVLAVLDRPSLGSDAFKVAFSASLPLLDPEPSSLGFVAVVTLDVAVVVFDDVAEDSVLVSEDDPAELPLTKEEEGAEVAGDRISDLVSLSEWTDVVMTGVLNWRGEGSMSRFKWLRCEECIPNIPPGVVNPVAEGRPPAIDDDVVLREGIAELAGPIPALVGPLNDMPNPQSLL